MDGSKTERVEVTKKFIHKLRCKFPKIPVETIDERLTTVAAHKTMNYLNIDKNKKTGKKYIHNLPVFACFIRKINLINSIISLDQ